MEQQNFILSSMEKRTQLRSSVKIAQEGFAETDPTSDVKVTMQLIN